MPTALGFLVDEKKTNDIIKERGGLVALLKQLAAVLIFLCFLALYTTLALIEPLRVHRSFEAYVHQRFDSQAAMPLDQVDSIEAFWLYMERSFLPGMYGNDTSKYTYPGYELQTFLPMDGVVGESGAIRILGSGALMRQVKILPNEGCQIPSNYEAEFPECYGPYKPGIVDTADYGPTGDQGGRMFVWTDPFPDSAQKGRLATYDSGGFMSLLNSNYTRSADLLRTYQDVLWLTRGTRAVFLDFTVYNFNLGLYCVSRILFEVSHTGKWVITFSTDVLRQRYLNPLGLGTDAELLLLAGEAVLVLFVLYYFVEECKEFAGFKKKKCGPVRLYTPKIKVEYFQDAWNILDLANLALIIVTLSYKIKTWGMAGDILVYTGDPHGQTVTTFTDYSQVAVITRLVRSLVAFNGVLTWFKAVKYINIFPYINIFMITVIKAQAQLISFCVLIMCYCTGFILAYSTAFGVQLSYLRSPWEAFVFLMRVFLGDADLGEIRVSSAPWLGPMLIVAFVVQVTFTSMNIFYGIMVTYVSISKAEDALAQREKNRANKEKAKTLWKDISKRLKLELRFRTFFPGLYSRIQNKISKQNDLEAKRSAALARKEEHIQRALKDDLGPASPNYGRRRRRKEDSDADGEGGALDDASDDGSEPDLGPLRSQQQLRGLAIDDAVPSFVATGSGSGSFHGARPSGGMKALADVAPGPEAEEIERKAVETMIKATEYIAGGIVRRTTEARGVLFSEMMEAQEVLQGIGNVLQVLNGRAQRLDYQQQQLLQQL